MMHVWPGLEIWYWNLIKHFVHQMKVRISSMQQKWKVVSESILNMHHIFISQINELSAPIKNLEFIVQLIKIEEITVFINYGCYWLLHITNIDGARTKIITIGDGKSIFACKWVNEWIMKYKNLNHNILGRVPNW